MFKLSSCLFALILISLFHTTQAQVYPISDMNEARSSHTATQIETAQVVVIGGVGDGNFLSSAEYWDQGNDQWLTLDPMMESRMNHTANSILGNRVLVCGGWNGDELSHISTEVFNFDLDAWEEGPNMSAPRSLHRANKLNSGEVLITGGTDNINVQESCELFDPFTLSFSDAASMEIARSSHTATLLNDGRVIVTGGYNPNLGFQLQDVEIYDPESNTWTTVAPMNEPRDDHAAIVINGNQLLVTGGRWFNATENRFEGRSDYEIYSVETDTWEGPYDLGAPASYHDMVLFSSFNENIFLPGGTDHSGVGVDLTYSQLMFFDSPGAPFVQPGDLSFTEKSGMQWLP